MTLIDYSLFEALPFSFMIVGLVLTFRYLKLIDLTFAASFALGPAVLARLLVDGHGFVFAFGAAVLLTGALTLLTLFLLLVLRLEGLLAGLVSSFAGYALSLLFTRGSLSISGIETPLGVLMQRDMEWFSGRVPLHPWQITVFAAACLLVKKAVDMFLHSEAGLAYRALEDERSARNLLPSLRISPDRLVAGGVLAGNWMCMLSGILVALKENQATAQRGFDALLTVIAAYLLGLTLFEKRPVTTQPAAGIGLVRVMKGVQRFEATGAALGGLLLYFVLLQSISRLDVPSSVPKLIIVGILVVGFTVSRWSELRTRVAGAEGDVTIPAASAEALVAEDVHVEYPGFPQPTRVLNGASIRVEPGQLVQLIGPNGSGKSTLLRYIAGEIGGRGRVVVPGAIARGNGAERRAAVALIPQDAGAATCATLTAREHLVLSLKGRVASAIRLWSRVALDDTSVLRRISAFANVPVACLSGGQRQVLNMTSVIVRRDMPRVVLFDEPLTYLDETNAGICVDLIEELLRGQCCILLVQHDLADQDSGQVEDNVESGTARSRLSSLITQRVQMEEIQHVDERP